MALKTRDGDVSRTRDNPVRPTSLAKSPHAVAAGWSYALPGWNSDGFDVQVFWLRLLSVLLLAPVPLLIYGAARRLSGQVSVASWPR